MAMTAAASATVLVGWIGFRMGQRSSAAPFAVVASATTAAPRPAVVEGPPRGDPEPPAPPAIGPTIAAVAAEPHTRDPNEGSDESTMRARIAKVIETQVAHIDTERQLDDFLDDLSRHAQSSGQVSALEFEPGMQAIRMMRSKLGPDVVERKRRAFLERMTGLATSTADGRRNDDQLGDLLGRIDRARSEEDRGRLQADYTRLASTLSGEERRKAMADLEKHK